MSSTFDKETEIMLPCIVGTYNIHGYEIFLQEEDQLTEQLYEAGNSPYESTTIVPMDCGLMLQTMRNYCELTGKEIAEEQGLEWVGCQEMEVRCMKRCSECDDAVFDHVEQEWYCRRTNILLCVKVKWPRDIEDKAVLAELKCYLEVDNGG